VAVFLETEIIQRSGAEDAGHFAVDQLAATRFPDSTSLAT
jgi:hypothetical protein